MKYFLIASKSLLLLSMVFFAASICPAQDESSTEIMGYYQQYRDFSFQAFGTQSPGTDIPATALKGGGFGIARNVVSWFALWSQTTFYGKVGTGTGLRARVINNLEGIRYQTKQHGPFRFYAKGGLGFSHVNFRGYWRRI